MTDASPADGKAAPSKSAVTVIIASVTVVIALVIWYGINRILEVTGSVLKKSELIFEISVDDVNGPVVSPDGNNIVYTQDGELWISDLAGEQTRRLDDTEGAERPFWSPDSRSVGYFRDATVGSPTIHTVSVEDNSTSQIEDLPAGYPYGAYWKQDGNIVVGLTPRTRGYGNAELYVVSGEDGKARVLQQPTAIRGESGMMYPSYLPDGNTMIYALTTLDGAGAIVAQSGETRTILIAHEGEAVAFPVYSPSGHIVYQRGFPRSNGIWALPIDPVTSTRMAQPFRISNTGKMPSVSDDGTLIFHIPPGGEMRHLIRVDRQGAILDTITTQQEEMDFPALSPDDSLVAVTAKVDQNIDIWIHKIKNKAKRRLTINPALDHFATWAPAGKHIAFSSNRNESGGIFIRRFDGRGKGETLVSSEVAWAPSWGRGNLLVYQSFSTESQGDLMYVRPWGGKRTPRQFLATPAFEATPVLSPNGGYVAYTSDVSGRPELYVTSFPRSGRIWQISKTGAALPRWSTHSNELFYIATSGIDDTSPELMATSVRTDGLFQFQPPQVLFGLDSIGSDTAFGNYDVTGNGQLFIIVQSIDKSPKVFIRIAENWHQEFKK